MPERGTNEPHFAIDIFLPDETFLSHSFSQRLCRFDEHRVVVLLQNGTSAAIKPGRTRLALGRCPNSTQAICRAV